MAAEVAEFVAPLALAQGKDIALLGATEPVWVKGNPEMLSRAIRNLAENAINHTAPGTTVEFVVEEDGTVSVLDHGPGVAEDERKLIFQRFWRRDRRKAGKHGSWPFHRPAHRRACIPRPLPCKTGVPAAPAFR